MNYSVRSHGSRLPHLALMMWVGSEHDPKFHVENISFRSHSRARAQHQIAIFLFRPQNSRVRWCSLKLLAVHVIIKKNSEKHTLGMGPKILVSRFRSNRNHLIFTDSICQGNAVFLQEDANASHFIKKFLHRFRSSALRNALFPVQQMLSSGWRRGRRLKLRLSLFLKITYRITKLLSWTHIAQARLPQKWHRLHCWFAMNNAVRGSWDYRMNCSTQKKSKNEFQSPLTVDLFIADSGGGSSSAEDDADEFETIHFLLCRPMRQVNGERLYASWRCNFREMTLDERIWKCATRIIWGKTNKIYIRR